MGSVLVSGRVPQGVTAVLTIGGTGFIGRHTVEVLLDDGYDVTVFSRGRRSAGLDDSVEQLTGDRSDRAAIEEAYEAVEPDIVIDFAAYHPADVRAATEVFADVDTYLYVSSTAAFDRSGDTPRLLAIPKVEGRTPLESCDSEQAVGTTYATYGPRKAEGDRIVFEAAANGVNAVSIRPTAVFGPHDQTERQDYWIDRVRRFDRIVVPGDGNRMPMSLCFVEDGARAVALVAEEGEPGEAYNMAARDHLTFDDLLALYARALDTEVELVHASDRELARVGVAEDDFPYCEDYPYIVSSEKLAALGWDSTPFPEAIPPTVEEHVRSDRDGSDYDMGRDVEEELLDSLPAGTVVGG